MNSKGPLRDLARPEPADVLRWSAWFGFVAGTTELVVFLLKCNLIDPRNYNVSRHFVWMYPLAGLAVIGVPGLVLALVNRLRSRRLSASVVTGVLTFFAGLGLIFRGPVSTLASLLLAGGLGVQVGRVLGERANAFGRLVSRTIPVFCVIFAVTIVGSFWRGRSVWPSAGAASSPSLDGSPNVILIVLDTVRADSLSLYGHARETSPNLAKMASRGVRFDRAFATAPWTAPSHASMFTGRWAGELSVGWSRPLDHSAPTLAEFLGGLGYDTAGFVANTTYCSYETGLDRGFARYDDYDVTPRAVLHCSAVFQRAVNFVHNNPRLTRWLDRFESSAPFRKSAERINRDFLEWEAGRAATNRPFFAFLNYYDAHHPYLTPESPDGKLAGERPESADDFRLLRSWWSVDKRRLDGRQVELARESYERCINYLDREIGRLHAELDRRGLLRNTIVIITADHGEHFGEHRLYGHGVSLYRPELHVPLVILGPGGVVPEGRTVSTPVSLRDLAATVVDRIGVDRRPAPFPGRSLASTWAYDPTLVSSEEPVRSEVESAPEDDPNRGESPARKGPMISLVAGGLHYIRNGDGLEELYDLERDSREEHDLAASPSFETALRRFRSRLR